jgi:hypothetical protein
VIYELRQGDLEWLPAELAIKNRVELAPPRRIAQPLIPSIPISHGERFAAHQVEFLNKSLELTR